MHKIIFAIFAHPDDEAFGPCATLCQAVEQGSELHLVCATNGAKGAGGVDLRAKEWQAAGKLIGAHAMHALGYGDGELCNNQYQEIAKRIAQLVRQACSAHQQTEVSFVTLDPNGLTGHLDHIAISLITTHVYYQLKQSPPAGARIKELAYYCLSKQQQPHPNLEYFVFAPAGHDDKYINRQVPVGTMAERKKAVIHCHQSQVKDAATFFAQPPKYHATENFHVVS